MEEVSDFYHCTDPLEGCLIDIPATCEAASSHSMHVKKTEQDIACSSRPG